MHSEPIAAYRKSYNILPEQAEVWLWPPPTIIQWNACFHSHANFFSG